MNEKKLEREMKEKKMSDSKMCAALGISRSAFYRKKNGLTEFTLTEIRKICEVLELKSPMGIFFEEKVS